MDANPPEFAIIRVVRGPLFRAFRVWRTVASRETAGPAPAYFCRFTIASIQIGAKGDVQPLETG